LSSDFTVASRRFYGFSKGEFIPVYAGDGEVIFHIKKEGDKNKINYVMIEDGGEIGSIFRHRREIFSVKNKGLS
jgi:hypothetical protein